jgi:plastocyanin
VNPGSYTRTVTLGISHALQANNEPVTLNATAPTGINVTFVPTSPVQLQGSTAGMNVTIMITASSAAALGNDTIKITGSAGSISQSSTFNLMVVQYRVVMVSSAFVPNVLNVTAGSTVYWQNDDGPAGGCGGGGGSGLHNIVFTTIPGANSSTMQQFTIFKYTFTTPGSYFYYSSLNSDHSMNGTINVLAASGGGGGMGMGDFSPMPVFSSFKGGDPAMITSPPVAAVTPPASVAGDLSEFSSAHPTIGVSQVTIAGLAILGVLGAALAVSTGKRRLTEFGFAVADRSADRASPHHTAA